MQHKLSSQTQCTHSSLFNLNEDFDAADLASDCCAPHDDLEIATGQASFDDGDIHYETSSRINSHHSRGIRDDSDDVLADFDYKYV